MIRFVTDAVGIIMLTANKSEVVLFHILQVGEEENKYQSYYGPGRRPLSYLVYYNAYDKPLLPPVHKYSSLGSTAQRAAGSLRWTLGYMHCAGSEGSMSSFKSIT